ncbi:DUF5995 family protein [Actinomycetospora endophytica]|uniref:DUF5995 family protein n=1 Tax=Actinomycetospora endophytica TaxID=2291215 RepID=A0ABS8PD62_9PSEU|nr:DUF5995 family protein [Actinomycetospora endophytica]MCD2196214.1 DUF5995 family protein [Actinomycetospora endophytica]
MGVNDALGTAVSTDPTDVPAVIETLDAVKKAAQLVVPRGEEDGIAAFTTLYHQITCGVQDAVNAGSFEAGTFIIDLDVAFACRYLAAIKALTNGVGRVPKCWEVLFSCRSDDSVPTLEYAAAGVNAHVNFDLAFALLTTWETHSSPAERDAQHRDYNRINDIFYANMNMLRHQFHSPFSDDGPLLDRLGNWFGDLLVRDTRDFAWDAAMSMWAHHDDPDWEEYRAAQEERRDHIAAVWGLGILHAHL